MLEHAVSAHKMTRWLAHAREIKWAEYERLRGNGHLRKFHELPQLDILQLLLHIDTHGCLLG